MTTTIGMTIAAVATCWVRSRPLRWRDGSRQCGAFRCGRCWRPSPGGLLLGYGAWIAYGCNIGAYLGGIASSSQHGWVWFGAAFAGNIVGTRFRPLFGLRG